MQYPGFLSALHMGRPSAAEGIGWLLNTGFNSLASAMERRRAEQRDDSRYREEMNFKKAYQDAQLEAMRKNMARQDLQDKYEYGYETVAPEGSVVGATVLPQQAGAGWLVQKQAPAFGVEPIKTDVSTVPMPVMRSQHIPGEKELARRIQERHMALAERQATREENRQAADDRTQALRDQLLQVQLNDALDPKTKELQTKLLLSQINAHNASAAAAGADADVTKYKLSAAKSAGPAGAAYNDKMDRALTAAQKLYATVYADPFRGGLIQGAPSFKDYLAKESPGLSRYYNDQMDALTADANGTAQPAPAPAAPAAAGKQFVAVAPGTPGAKYGAPAGKPAGWYIFK